MLLGRLGKYLFLNLSNMSDSISTITKRPRINYTEISIIASSQNDLLEDIGESFVPVILGDEKSESE